MLIRLYDYSHIPLSACITKHICDYDYIISYMARITVKIDDDLEKQVRIKMAHMGGKKGDLSKAVEDGLTLWLLSFQH